MKAPAFQFYPDDFIGGTVDLSSDDVGCYIRLLCYQWGRGEIPATKAACNRVAGSQVSPEVMAKFPDRKNPRMERERIKQAEYRDAQSRNGSTGARKRWHGDAIAPLQSGNGVATVSLMASGMARNSSPSPSPSPSPISDTEFRLHDPSASPTNDGAAESIYEIYPRKQGRKDALKAIRLALKSKPAAALEASVRAFADAVALWPAADQQFVPHPATWFNRGSYDDDPATWVRQAPDRPAGVHGRISSMA